MSELTKEVVLDLLPLYLVLLDNLMHDLRGQAVLSTQARGMQVNMFTNIELKPV